MHHKRKRPKNSRAGCLMCKPWKVNGAPTVDQLKPSENRLVQDDEPRPSHQRSDRRRWCRGKVGVEHELVCMTYQEAKGALGRFRLASERFLVCKVCGKELENYRGYEKIKPAWVTC